MSCLAALQCSVDNLPSPFGDRSGRDDNPRSEVPDRDRFQAIVPAYTFQCSGRVTEWGACVRPGGQMREQFYIQFQVWRPTGPSGCYSLVGFNRPVGSQGEDGVLSPPGVSSAPLHRCVVLPVTEEEQIEVQSGDVVGYYVDHDNDIQNDNAGIQWIEGGSDVVVHYRDDLPREDIRSHYALGGLNPTVCGFPISGSSASYSLSTLMFATPIISLSIGLFVLLLNVPIIIAKTISAVVTPTPTVPVSSSNHVGRGMFASIKTTLESCINHCSAYTTTSTILHDDKIDNL